MGRWKRKHHWHRQSHSAFSVSSNSSTVLRKRVHVMLCHRGHQQFRPWSMRRVVYLVQHWVGAKRVCFPTADAFSDDDTVVTGSANSKPIVNSALPERYSSIDCWTRFSCFDWWSVGSSVLGPAQNSYSEASNGMSFMNAALMWIFFIAARALVEMQDGLLRFNSQRWTLLCVQTKDGPKSHSRTPKELLQTCIRPFFLHLLDYARHTAPLLHDLSKLLSLLSLWFNKTLCVCSPWLINTCFAFAFSALFACKEITRRGKHKG